MTDYGTIPDGFYRVRVASVRVDETRFGDERWSLELRVIEPSRYVDRLAAWDALVWSKRGENRARNILEKIGFKRPHVNRPKPDDLLGRTAMIEVRCVTVCDADGRSYERAEVPYSGWLRDDHP